MQPIQPISDSTSDIAPTPISPVSSVPVVVTAVAPEPPVSPSRHLVQIWNMPFDVVTLDDAVDDIGMMIERREPTYVITANLNYVMLHNQRRELQAVTEAAGLIVADGQPIVWRSKLDSVVLPERVAGSEMIYRLAQRASQEGWSIYFLGGEPDVGEACARELVRLYPGLKIAGVESPPFRQLTPQEQLEQDQRIQASGADLLLVAFGQPKGEQWIYDNHQRLGVPVSIQLGASFDFVAGTAKRAPKLWQKTGMEWFYRMASDPNRLIPRYAANAWFLLTALLGDWHRKVQSWGMGLEEQPPADQRRG